MAAISLRNITKTYPGGFTAVHDFSLEIPDKEFVILVGPSGCGKSTVLRMVAGLETISSGELYIGGKLVNALSPKDRNIAMVFQNYALYPHMTVYENMAFSLALRHVPKEEIACKVNEAAAILGLTSLLKRKPGALSGGQRQRVALGRAMVREPAVFLLDEPLSNLDAKLRTQMRAEISRLHTRLGTTFIYVTHDQTEAMTMADRIVVMKDGFILQADSPQHLYDHPCDVFVAGFIGSPQMNFLPVRLGMSGSRYTATFGETEFLLPEEKTGSAGMEKFVGRKCLLGIRPEHLHVASAEEASPAACVEGIVELAEHTGAETFLYLKNRDVNIIAKVPTIAVRYGEVLRVKLDMAHIYLFDAESQEAIFN